MYAHTAPHISGHGGGGRPNTDEALRVQQVFGPKSYKVHTVSDFQMFVFSSLSIFENERWLAQLGVIMQRPELGTRPGG